jgi:hypothetical protein
MPPKTGLLGTLSALALGAGMAMSSGGVAQAQEGLDVQIEQFCEWIRDKTVLELQTAIDGLRLIDENNVCIEIAAARIVELNATAAGLEPPQEIAYP